MYLLPRYYYILAASWPADWRTFRPNIGILKNKISVDFPTLNFIFFRDPRRVIGCRLRDRQVLLVSYWLVVLLLGCSVQFCSYIQMLLLLERVPVADCIVRCDEIQNNTSQSWAKM